MTNQERSFYQIFGEHPEPTDEVTNGSLLVTLYGVALLLKEDPSEDAVKDAMGFLSQKPEEYIDRAYKFLLYSEKLESRSEVNDGMILVEGIVNKVWHAYDPQTQSLPADFNFQLEAEEVADSLRLNKEEKRWKELNTKLLAEENPSEKVGLAFQFKQEVMDYIPQGSIRFERDSRRVIPKWENISQQEVTAEISLRHSEEKVESLTKLIQDIRRIVDRSDLEIVLSQLPKFDKERFDALRNRYGAKGANLTLLSEVSLKMNKLLWETEKVPDLMEMEVPDFFLIPVDVYKKWKNGENIDDDLSSFFIMTKDFVIDGNGFYENEQDAYIVRSSTVNSEDGEKLTGAGIYNSVVVDYDNADDFSSFRNAVVSVFESVDSPKAKSYRQQNSIDSEEMGLIVQRFKPDKYQDVGRSTDGRHITINSSAFGMAQYIEVSERGSRFFARKDVIDQNLATRIPENATHFRPDFSKDSLSNNQIIDYALWVTILEKVWGSKIQLECVGHSPVQIRKVTGVSSSEIIEFPDEKEILRGNGVGVGDKTLTVLGLDENNCLLDGLVQIESNHKWSIRGNTYYLPKEGAVVIKDNEGQSGHLQTLCIEKGLICMYPFDDSDSGDLPDLKEDAQVRIVSNGIEARMYQVPGSESPILSNDEI